MKKLLFVTALTAAVASALVTSAVQDSSEAEMMQKWTAYMTPAEPHADLVARVGEWTFESTMFGSPGAEPQQGSGTCRTQAVLGGRYIAERIDGTMMGLPYQGLSVVGYDNALGHYHSTWFDSLGTGVTRMTGTKVGAVTSYAGTMVDPIAGREVPFRFVQKEIDADHTEVTMYAVAPTGEEYVTMRMKLTRKKSEGGE